MLRGGGPVRTGDDLYDVEVVAGPDEPSVAFSSGLGRIMASARFRPVVVESKMAQAPA